MVQEFKFYGKSEEELKGMSLKEFVKLIPARQRRSILRGLSEEKKKFLENIRKTEKPVKTHLRDMIIIPEMLQRALYVSRSYKSCRQLVEIY